MVLKLAPQEALGLGAFGNLHALVSKFYAKNKSLSPQQQNKCNDSISYSRCHLHYIFAGDLLGSVLPVSVCRRPCIVEFLLQGGQK